MRAQLGPGVWFLVMCTVAIAALLAAWWPTDTTFACNLKLEWLQASIQDGNPEWSIPLSASILSAADINRSEVRGIRLDVGSLATFERIGTGAIKVNCQPAKGANHVGFLIGLKGSEQDIRSEVDIVVAKVSEMVRLGQSLRIPFRAILRLPELSRFASGEPIPLLRSGSISLIGRSLVGHGFYEANKLDLRLGDTLSYDPGQISTGLVLLGEGEGLDVSYEFSSKSIRVLRFHSEGFDEQSSTAARVIGDKSFQVIWVTLVFALGTLNKFRPPSKKDGGAEKC